MKPSNSGGHNAAPRVNGAYNSNLFSKLHKKLSANKSGVSNIRPGKVTSRMTPRDMMSPKTGGVMYESKPGMFRRYLNALLYVAVAVAATWSVALVMAGVAYTCGWIR